MPPDLGGGDSPSPSSPPIKGGEIILRRLKPAATAIDFSPSKGREYNSLSLVGERVG